MMEMKAPYRICWVVIMFCLIVLAPFSANFSKSKASEEYLAKVDPALIQIAEGKAKEKEGILVTPQGIITSTSLALEKLRVIIEVEGPVEEVVDDISGFDKVKVEKIYGPLIQTLVPKSILKSFYRKLARLEGVNLIQLPIPSTTEVLSQGVKTIGATEWHDQGITGKGVRIAIVDHGFVGYSSLLGKELPTSSSVKVRSFREDGDITGGQNLRTDHGTACAEIVHDVAPDAYLYLVNFETRVELGKAVDWLIEEDVDIISFSISFINGRYDGNSLIDQIVQKARNHGVLWITSAGNYAKRHWEGDWVDHDQDGWLDFKGGDETQTIKARKDGQIVVGLSWDDPWAYSSNNYDLYLYDNNGKLLGASERIQNGWKGWVPAEGVKLKIKKGGIYHIKVKEKKATRKAHLELFTPNQKLEYSDPSSSIMTPGASPYALTIGAVAWDTNKLRYYSSRGPTNDGRTKPDLVAPDGVRTRIYDKFYGTSASTPHVAGAAALAKQANNPDSPSEIKEYLADQTEDLGTPGKDNSYGSGRIDLGRPPEIKRPPERPPAGRNLGNLLPNELLGYELRFCSEVELTLREFCLPPDASNPIVEYLRKHSIKVENTLTGYALPTRQNFSSSGIPAPALEKTVPIFSVSVYDLASTHQAGEASHLLRNKINEIQEFNMRFCPGDLGTIHCNFDCDSDFTCNSCCLVTRSSSEQVIQGITVKLQSMIKRTWLCGPFETNKSSCVRGSPTRQIAIDLVWSMEDLVFTVGTYPFVRGAPDAFWEHPYTIAETLITHAQSVIEESQTPDFPPPPFGTCDCNVIPGMCDFGCSCDPYCDTIW